CARDGSSQYYFDYW
nr:immunoglobulin heavy chain junction region [Mus musculus]